MEGKKADNKIIKKSSKKNVEDRLFDEKKIIKKLDSIEEEIYSLKKNVDTCISLLDSSIKGGNIHQSLEEISNDNNKFLSNVQKAIEDERESANKRIKELKEKIEEKE